MSKILLTILFILFIIVSLVFVYNAVNEPADTEEPITNVDTNTSPSFQTYSNDEFGIQIDVPARATVERNSIADVVEIRVLGANNEANTEITDGYTFSLRRIQDATTTDVFGFAEEEMARLSGEGSRALEQLRSTQVGRKEAYMYTYETALGTTAKSYFVMPNPNTGYIITTGVFGADAAQYQSIVDMMMSSLVFTATSSVPNGPETEIEALSDLIRVETPEMGETISSPVTVRGEARGTWYFEASFPITVVDWNGLIIGEGFATAQDEWMTEEFVPFEGTVEFDLPEDTPYRRGALIFRKDNPSGLPEHDRALELPVTF